MDGLHTCMHAYMHTCKHAYVTCIHPYIPTLACLLPHLHTYTITYTYTYTDRPTGRPTDRLTDWQTDRPTDIQYNRTQYNAIQTRPEQTETRQRQRQRQTDRDRQRETERQTQRQRVREMSERHTDIRTYRHRHTQYIHACHALPCLAIPLHYIHCQWPVTWMRW